MTASSISGRLIQWYKLHGRALPWRTRTSPYRVWISEIMLQQTRVDTVIPYFQRWMRRFPSVKALAAASEREVLSAWEGLGYYARARSLRRAAQLIVKVHGGRIPADADALRRLPGVGPYTAGAIASIAFGLDEPVLDGNVRRVLARLFDVGLPADSTSGNRRFWDLAREHLPPGRAADYNQALMDLGATICLPVAPRCPICPLRMSCIARRRGTVDRRPVLRPRRTTRLYHVGAAVVVSQGRVLLSRRDSKGLLGGMWEFPNTRLDHAGGASRQARLFVLGLEHAYGVRLRPDGVLCQLTHAYSHFRVDVKAHACQLISPVTAPGLRWIRLDSLARYPMGKVDRAIARSVVEAQHAPPRRASSDRR